IFLDPGAQEYAANQVREEARHVHAFSRYVQARFDGRIFPVGDTVGRLLGELVATPVVYKKIVGMQMLVEGVAMGAFTTLYKIAQDPLLRRVCQLVMTDEAFHHKFGKIWAHATLPQLGEAEHQAVEDWALECFNTLLFNLVNPEQKRLIYPQFGLDWEWVRDAVLEARTDEPRPLRHPRAGPRARRGDRFTWAGSTREDCGGNSTDCLPESTALSSRRRCVSRPPSASSDCSISSTSWRKCRERVATDFRKLIETLATARVDFVVLGGIAVCAPRAFDGALSRHMPAARRRVNPADAKFWTLMSAGVRQSNTSATARQASVEDTSDVAPTTRGSASSP